MGERRQLSENGSHDMQTKSKYFSTEKNGRRDSRCGTFKTLRGVQSEAFRSFRSEDLHPSLGITCLDIPRSPSILPRRCPSRTQCVEWRKALYYLSMYAIRCLLVPMNFIQYPVSLSRLQAVDETRSVARPIPLRFANYACLSLRS